MAEIVHFCAGLSENNGMANTARQFVAEERARGDASCLVNDMGAIAHDVDVVCIHGAWLPVLWRVAKRTKAIGARLIIRPAGSYDPVRLSYHRWRKRLVAPFEHRMLRRADVVLATCRAEAEWIAAYEPQAKIELTDLRRFFALGSGRVLQPDGLAARETGTGLHLLYMGRRHPLKGVEYLERVVAENNAALSDADVRRLDLRLVSDAFGEEKERVWAWCDVLVLPTLSENFGRVVAEALERGKSVITTDGAPAWEPTEDLLSETSEMKVGYGGRLLYLLGYREGDAAKRMTLLRVALEKMAGNRLVECVADAPHSTNLH